MISERESDQRVSVTACLLKGGRSNDPRKRLDMRVLRRMAIPLALVLAASFLVFPGGVLAASVPGPGADSGKATSMSLKELAKTRPYYAPDVAARTNPLSGELDRVAQKSVPSELLLASLLPQRSDETLKQNAGTGLAGAGTGGWTELKRMYMPSSDPDVTYRLYPGDSNNNVIDINGRRHDIYARRVSTDVSQPPDPAGIARKDLARIYYSTYSEGSWSNPINLTPTAGFQDTAAVLFETDDAGYLHFVYSRWSWTRDSSFAPGTPDAYQHSDENLFYRYRAPDGTWSAPRALTSFTGMWGIPGAFFTLENGRIYGTWLETFDRETAPASFTTRLLFMEGIRGDWDSARTIRHWDYTMGLGVEMPFSSPGLGVSPVTGEVILAYGTLMYGAGPDQHKTWIHAMVRSPGGSWSGPTRLVTATPNVYWIPTIVRYDRDGTTSNLLAIKTTIFLNSGADPPQTNMYLITHKASGWKSPLNATRLTAGHAFDAIDLSVDTFDTWHFTVSSGTFEWDAAHSQWNDVGDQLRYTYRTGATVSAYQTILGYHDGRFIGNVNAVVDRDGKIRALFDTHLTSAYDGTDYKVFYSDNVEGPGFSTPKKLTADSGQKVDNASLTTDPRGGSLRLVVRVQVRNGEPSSRRGPVLALPGRWLDEPIEERDPAVRE